MTTSVVIVDDHPIVRVGLRGLVESADDLAVVGEAASADEALCLVDALLPDVVLMDLRMPGMDGATATALISERHPEVRVLVLTTYDTDGDIMRAMEAGATGYLLKDVAVTTLVEAVRAAARGESVLAPLVATRLVAHLRNTGSEQPTPRETEVLQLVARGLSNAAIGQHLHIGEATVKTHLLRAFAKLGVNDRTAAVTEAMARGLLEQPGRGGRTG